LTSVDELTRISESVKSAHKRIDDVEVEVKDLRDLTRAIAVTNTNVEGLQKDVGEIKVDVKNLSSIPAKRWETAVGVVITGVVGIVIGALMALIIK